MLVRFGLLLGLCCGTLMAQGPMGVVAGSVSDSATGEPLTGATVTLQGTTAGAFVDVDGNYVLQAPAGTYTLVATYPEYRTLHVNNVVVKPNQTTSVDILLTLRVDSVADIVIIATPDQASQGSIIARQQNAPFIADGVSASFIRTTPDRDLTQVMRRVSGVTVQDGGFLIVRGLSERYTMAVLNGLPMPSTEPDRRAFSFDIFPSNIVDNLFVVKTAAPDQPAEFAGAIVQVSTLSLPSRPFLNFSVTEGWHSRTTFQEFQLADGPRNRWLGLDDGTRSLPSGLPGTQALVGASDSAKVTFGQLYGRSWGAQQTNAAPDSRWQLSGGYVHGFGEQKRTKLSLIGSLSSSIQRRTVPTERADYLLEGGGFQRDYLFRDTQSNLRILNSALLGLGLQIRENHQISLRSTATINTLEQNVYREGELYFDDFYRRAHILYYNSNLLAVHQMQGEHNFKAPGLRWDWAANYSTLASETPDYRRLVYIRPLDSINTRPQAAVPTAPTNPGNSGTFFSSLDQQAFAAATNLEKTFKIAERRQAIKTGALVTSTRRTFNARNLGFRHFPEGIPFLGIPGFDTELLYQGPDSIFLPSNMRDTSGYFLDEITNPTDYYEGTQDLAAGYLMLDNTLGRRWRIVWGVRLENFRQEVRTYATSDTQRDSLYAAVNKTYLNFLPSLNIAFRLRDAMNLRVAASQTLARPTLRELAPFAFYDFQINLITEGNTNLQQTTIWNADLRWEWFPGRNQLLSATAFYKRFENPIEQSYFFDVQPAIVKNVNAQNGAENFGLEVEIRKNFDFLGKALGWAKLDFLYGLVNFAYIQSRVDVSNIPGEIEDFRPLQGQSSYVLNGGLQYLNPETGTTISLLVNRFGRRIWQIGIASPTAPDQSYPHIWENPRTVFDIKVAQRFWKQRLEVNITAADLFAPDQVFYQDVNTNCTWDEGTDNLILRMRMGRSISVGAGLRF